MGILQEIKKLGKKAIFTTSPNFKILNINIYYIKMNIYSF